MGGKGRNGDGELKSQQCGPALDAGEGYARQATFAGSPEPSPGYLDSAGRRVLKGLGANFIGQILNLASRVLLVPLFLHAWGADIYGQWLMLSSLVMYLSLSDLGAQLYVVNRLTQAYTRGDLRLFSRVMQSGLALFLVVPGAVFMIFLIASLFVPPSEFLQLAGAEGRLYWVLCLLALQVVLTLPQGLLLGVYRAVGMLPRGVMLANLMQLLQIMFVATGLAAGAGMVAVAGLQIAPVLIVLVMAIRQLRRLFPALDLFSLRGAKLGTVREFVKPSLHFLLIQVAQACASQGMVLVVGVVLAPVQVVVFFTLRTMTNLMRQLFAAVTQAVWPEITRLDAARDSYKLAMLFRALMRSTLLIGVLVAAFLHFFGRPVYQLWLGKSVEFQQATLDLLLIYVLQLVFWTACRNVLMATNEHHGLSRLLAASAVLGLGLAYLGGRNWGLDGVVIGMIAGDLILPFWAVPYLMGRRQLRLSPGFCLREGWPVVAAVGVIALFPLGVPIVILLLGVWWLRCLPGPGLTWRESRLETGGA